MFQTSRTKFINLQLPNWNIIIQQINAPLFINGNRNWPWPYTRQPLPVNKLTDATEISFEMRSGDGVSREYKMGTWLILFWFIDTLRVRIFDASISDYLTNSRCQLHLWRDKWNRNQSILKKYTLVILLIYQRIILQHREEPYIQLHLEVIFVYLYVFFLCYHNIC